MPRLDARVKTDLQARLRCEDFEEAVRVSELSLNGAMLDSSAPRLNDVFTIRMKLPEAGEVELSGEVVRIADGKAAVRFFYPDASSLRELWNFLSGRVNQGAECPYCGFDKNAPLNSYCDKCGLYLLFDDPAYLERHLEETFVSRIISRLNSLSPGQMQKIIAIMDSELLRGTSGQAGRVPGPERPGQEYLGASNSMRDVFSIIRKVAATDLNVLVLGENGTGKDITARAIHERGRNPAGPFIEVDCSVYTDEDSLEKELFGCTDGQPLKAGALADADGGTLFLNEIEQLPLPLQTRLLRYFDEKGPGRGRPDLRLIAASSVDLARAAQNGDFRSALYFRLNAFTIKLPPLRERGQDKIVLAQYFLRKLSGEKTGHMKTFAPGALRAINNYEWPGNVRELIGRIERAVIMSSGEIITAGDLELYGYEIPVAQKGLAGKLSKQYIMQRLSENQYVIARTARALSISRPTLYSLINKYEISFQKSKRFS